jgi:hypothetical protein
VTIRDHVLARVEALEPGQVVTSSVLAWSGHRLNRGAVWRTLELLWEDGLVERRGEDRWARRVVGEVQMSMEGTA